MANATVAIIVQQPRGALASECGLARDNLYTVCRWLTSQDWNVRWPSLTRGEIIGISVLEGRPEWFFWHLQALPPQSDQRWFEDCSNGLLGHCHGISNLTWSLGQSWMGILILWSFGINGIIYVHQLRVLFLCGVSKIDHDRMISHVWKELKRAKRFGCWSLIILSWFLQWSARKWHTRSSW